MAALLLGGCAPAVSDSGSDEISRDESIASGNEMSVHDKESSAESPESSEAASDSSETASESSEDASDSSEETIESSDTEVKPEPSDDELVLISEHIKGIKTDIRYATENNFTGKVIYDSAEAYLRYGTVKKLAAVQAELNELGYELLIWDAYRPTGAQWKLWEICPDGNFVSDPNKGYSSHSRGNTVDITVVRLDGTAVEMPSGFDEFTALADRDYSDVSAEAGNNAKMLEEIMKRNGFSGYRKEWWHYSDTVRYDVAE